MINTLNMIWDYITFNSGHRNNYWKGNQVDIGAWETYSWYNWWESKSRDANYKAGYLLPADICSGYAMKLWNTYNGGVKYFSYVYGNAPAWSPSVIYYQI
jgi:hypothetical protein